MKIENPESKKDSRIIYLDLLRIICTFSVVILHTSGYAWSILPYTNPAWSYVNFYDGFSRFSVPIFIMISGVFMLSDKKNLDIKNLFYKKILRLVKLFLVYSSLYAIVINIIYSDTFNSFSFIKQILVGHYHLWYLYAIIGLYIITPLLKGITKNNYLTKYFLVTAFIFEILFGTISSIVKTVNLTVFFSKSYLYFVKGFTIYYVLGYFVFNSRINKKNIYILYILGIVFTAFTIAGTKWYSIYTMENNDIFYSFLSVNVFFQSLSIFVFFKEIISKIKFTSFWENLIKALSKYSLGIYLIHDFFLILFLQFNINCLSFNPLFSIPLLSIVIFALSYFSIFLLSNRFL